MNKILSGLLAIMTTLIAMSAPALAEDAQTEEVIEQPPVDCTLNNNTPQEWRNADGSYPSGTPITLEIHVPKGGPMETYFVASLNGGEEYRLNDESLTAIGWTPIDPGSYMVRGEFIDENDNVLPVEDPASCAVPVVVAAPAPVVPEEPTTPTTEPTSPFQGECDEPLTLVPTDEGFSDVYNRDGLLCATIGSEGSEKPQTLPRCDEDESLLTYVHRENGNTDVYNPGGQLCATILATSPPAELPRTGSGTLILTFVGFMLLLVGAGFRCVGMAVKR